MEQQDRIDELRDHVYAVQLLLMAHIVAADIEAPGVAAITAGMAESQNAALVAAGRNRVVIRLQAIIEEIAQCLSEDATGSG